MKREVAEKCCEQRCFRAGEVYKRAPFCCQTLQGSLRWMAGPGPAPFLTPGSSTAWLPHFLLWAMELIVGELQITMQKLIPWEVNWLWSKLSHVAKDKGSPLGCNPHLQNCAHRLLMLRFVSGVPADSQRGLSTVQGDRITGEGRDECGLSTEAVERSFFWDTRVHWKAVCDKHSCVTARSAT